MLFVSLYFIDRGRRDSRDRPRGGYRGGFDRDRQGGRSGYRGGFRDDRRGGGFGYRPYPERRGY